MSSTLQIGLAVAGGVVLAALVAHEAWKARTLAPRQPARTEAPPADVAGGIEPQLDADPFTPESFPLPPPEKKAGMDGLIDVIAPVALEDLVSGDAALAAQFQQGEFATLYLSPRDYHRIHMPCAGRLTRMIHVPGELFSVNPTTARGVPGLFARNERVVCVFEGEHGPFVMVLVGATIVGSMATVWHGVVNPPRPGTVREWTYEMGNITLAQGEEMGRFLLGSTVVMLFPSGVMQFNPDWTPTRPIVMGEAMGAVR